MVKLQAAARLIKAGPLFKPEKKEDTSAIAEQLTQAGLIVFKVVEDFFIQQTPGMENKVLRLLTEKGWTKASGGPDWEEGEGDFKKGSLKLVFNRPVSIKGKIGRRIWTERR